MKKQKNKTGTHAANQVAAHHRKVLLKRSLFFYATTIALTIYMGWRIFFTLPLQYGMVNLVCGILLLAMEMVSFFQMVTDYRQLFHYMEPELPVIPESWYPEVDVLIATHNESVDLLYKTVNACTFLRYPCREKVRIYICDDSNRPEMAELAKELGVGYFGLEGNQEAKAGNLNNALRQTSAPLVVTFDADMMPRSEFLLETVPFFFLPRIKKDESGVWVPIPEEEIDPHYKIGYIQTPQSFYNPDLFQYYLYSEGNIPNEQDYFFREVNVAHNYDNAPIYAGSNTVLSREALEEVGYIATESITEDFMTGVRIQKAKYTNYAISKPLAQGLAPDRIKSLLNQRERWARGNIQTMRRENVLLTSKLSVRQKFSNFSSFMYWQGYLARMIFILAPTAQVLFSMRFLDAPIWQVLLFWLPTYLLYNRTLRVLSGNITNHHWSNVVDTIFAPYLFGPILAENIGVSKRKFVVTDKARRIENRRWRTALFSLPYLIMTIACAVAIAMLIQQSIAMRMIYNPIVLYWLVINLKNLLFAVFFMFGRSNVRMAERFYVELPATIGYQGMAFEGRTTDISETGFAIVLDRPAYLPPEELLRVAVSSGRYEAEVDCRLVGVSRKEDKWKYGFQIQEMDEENKRVYMQVVYDRRHTLPTMLSPNASVFLDINTNLMKRTRRRQASKRKLPRLIMDLPFETDQGRRGTLLDLNFEHAGMVLDFSVQDDDILALDFGEDLVLELRASTDIQSRTSTLFHVLNIDLMQPGPALEAMVDAWSALQTIPSHLKPVGRARIWKAEAPQLAGVGGPLREGDG